MLKMKNVNLYNQDGSLCTEAQTLLSGKPTEMSMGEWKKKIKELKVLLSIEDLKEFERLKKNSIAAKYRTENPEKVKQINVKCYAENPEKSKQRTAKWRAENPEQSNQIQANWYGRNPEKVKQNNAKWYAENTEKAKTLNAKWYAENTEKAKTLNAKWYAENTEKAKQNSANWRADNPEKAKSVNANWRAENPEKAKTLIAKWRAENHEHVASCVNNYQKQRRANDPLYRFQCNMRSMGNRVVKQLALGKKPASTLKWQGCTAEELKTHFESLFLEGMTWDNYGEWHIDHIRPVCSFSAEEWEQINHYTNLQPLWAEDNLSKSDSW